MIEYFVYTTTSLPDARSGREHIKLTQPSTDGRSYNRRVIPRSKEEHATVAYQSAPRRALLYKE